MSLIWDRHVVELEIKPRGVFLRLSVYHMVDLISLECDRNGWPNNWSKSWLTLFHLLCPRWLSFTYPDARPTNTETKTSGAIPCCACLLSSSCGAPKVACFVKSGTSMPQLEDLCWSWTILGLGKGKTKTEWVKAIGLCNWQWTIRLLSIHFCCGIFMIMIAEHASI